MLIVSVVVTAAACAVGATIAGRAGLVAIPFGLGRNEGVTETHIYAPNDIITHGLLTLSAITAQSYLSLW
jgi:hypothetical protein